MTLFNFRDSCILSSKVMFCDRDTLDCSRPIEFEIAFIKALLISFMNVRFCLRYLFNKFKSSSSPHFVLVQF